MQSKDYWLKRALQREAEAFQNTNDTVKNLRAIYDMAANRLVRVVKKVFANYMHSASVPPDKAKELLSIQETADVLEELRGEYVKKGSIEALAKLNAPAYAYRINRAQALLKAIDAEAQQLAETEEQTGEKLLAKTYDDTFYKTMYDAAKDSEQDVTFAPLSQKDITEAVENRWKGENYSERVWKNTHLVAKEAGKIIDTGISSGMSVAQMSHEIKDLFNVASYAAERLVRTEVNRMHNDAAVKSYKAMGVKEYTYLATLDARTCSVCGHLDGQHFKVVEARTGVNLPPMHPNDRCTTVAYYPGDKITGTRIARDPTTGKSYKVRRDMTYEEWRKEIGSESLDTAQKMIRNRAADMGQKKAMRHVLGKEVPANIAEFQDLKYNNPEEWKRLKEFYSYKLENPKANRTHFNIATELKAIGIKGKIHVPAKGIDTVSLDFDDKHINIDREHAVTIQEAKSFINNADVSITKWQGQYENYYSKNGASYVNLEGQYVRTAYKADQFKGEPEKIREVIEKYEKGNVPPPESGN